MRVLVFAAAVALSACMPQAPQQGSPSQSQQTQQIGAVTTTPVAVESGKPGPGAPAETSPILDRDFLVGRWGDNGDCTKDVVLSPDGSFRSYTGGEGQWSIGGTTLRMEGKQSTQEVEIELVDQDTVRITNPDGSVGTSQRCT